jgi:protein arginine N-methyltransferase 1
LSTYSIAGYGEMIADRVRIDAHAQALRQAVKPGSIVVDIGTGTGIFAVLACRYGARRVYALEPSDVIEVARETAAADGCADRIEFIQALSTKVALPVRADVILSDLRGVLPPLGSHIPSIADARERLLAPGGTLIPQRDRLWGAVVSAPDVYDRHVTPWGRETLGVDMEPSRRKVANTWRKHRFQPEQIVLPPQLWGTLDYRTVTQPDVAGEMAWIVERPATAHGLAVWFDALLAEGVAFSNAPGGPELIYGNAFFPWSSPVDLDIGDTVTVALHADLVGDDYVWRWDARVLAQGHPERAKANFRQSTFFGAPLAPQRLRKQSSGYVPELNADGEIDRYVLSQIDGAKSLMTIAKELAVRHPERFHDWHQALTRVGELSQRYSDT